MTLFPFYQPPSALLFATEPWRASLEYFASQMSFPESHPQGDGHPVLVFPGFCLSGSATAQLRVRLERLHYVVYDWEHGINTLPGVDLDDGLRLLGQQLERIHAVHRRPVSLIGWSLGGIYSRELAKRHPALVRQVITLGTPYAGTLASMHARWRYGGLGPQTGAGEALLERLHIHPPVPSVSIYSRADGIVAWRECVGDESTRHRNIEVEGVSHLGMAHHPHVLGVLAELLTGP